MTVAEKLGFSFIVIIGIALLIFITMTLISYTADNFYWNKRRKRISYTIGLIIDALIILWVYWVLH